MSTFLELRTELSARGFDALSTTRLGVIVNQAVSEVDASYPWPYRLTTTTGNSPLAIATLGEIDTVTDTARKVPLDPMGFQALTDIYGDITRTGLPCFFYVTWAAGVPSVVTVPTTVTALSVRHYAIPTALAADGDVPAPPLRFHMSVYMAVASRMAAVETGGDPAGWASEADRGLQAMLMSLLPDQVAGQAQRVSYDAADW